MKFNKIGEDFIRYNANADNKDVGDCVRRAISLAYNLPYERVRKDLFSLARQHHSSSKTFDIYEQYIQQLGVEFYRRYQLGDRYTVDEITKEFPVGTYLILCKLNANSRVGHMVCAIDGDIYDSWDSRKAIVWKVFCVTSQAHVKRNENQDTDWEEYIKNSFNTACQNNAKMAHRFPNIMIRKKTNLTYEVCAWMSVSADEAHADNELQKAYSWEYSSKFKKKFEVRTLKATNEEVWIAATFVKFTPFATDDEKKEQVELTINDILKTLLKQPVALMREYNKLDQKKNMQVNDYFRGDRDLLASCPSWAHPYITGAYDDSYTDYGANDRMQKFAEYTIYMNPLEDDPDQHDMVFRGTKPEIKRAMNWYKNTFERMNI